MSTHPHVVVIGAGPVGLTAAAHLFKREIPFTVLEAGHRVGASIREWGHVRLFSPWAMDIDPDAAALLSQVGVDAATGRWASHRQRPCRPLSRTVGRSSGHPTQPPPRRHRHRRDPLGTQPSRHDRARRGAIRGSVRAGRTRAGTDRDGGPRRVRHVDHAQPVGVRRHPGAWRTRAASDRIHYGIPDVAGVDRDRYANKRIAVAGGGHSAANVLLDLAAVGADRARHEGDMAVAAAWRRPTRRRRRQRRVARAWPARYERSTASSPKGSSPSSTTSVPTASRLLRAVS